MLMHLSIKIVLCCSLQFVTFVGITFPAGISVTKLMSRRKFHIQKVYFSVWIPRPQWLIQKYTEIWYPQSLLRHQTAIRNFHCYKHRIHIVNALILLGKLLSQIRGNMETWIVIDTTNLIESLFVHPEFPNSTNTWCIPDCMNKEEIGLKNLYPIIGIFIQKNFSFPLCNTEDLAWHTAFSAPDIPAQGSVAPRVIAK